MASSCLPSVIVSLSGGVDSAVAALLLRQAGHPLQGLYMSNWEEDDDDYCTNAEDYQDARRVAAELGIALHRVSFASQYRERVFAHFLADYRAGRTPNPDVLCNREIKFALARDYARRLGADWFATGHYARALHATDGPGLYRASDEAKDQSYFLHAVDRPRFAQVLFPIGDLTKDEVRERARRGGLPVHDKPDSTGICFIGERPFADFLARYIDAEPGPIETLTGERLGTHRGLAFYTLGQRTGLAIGGTRGGAQEPWYVAGKDTGRNTLVVVQRHQREPLLASGVRIGELNWLAPVPTSPIAVQVRLRHRQPLQSARLELGAGRAVLSFAEPQRAATPGQYAVLYAGQRCLGGGLIDIAILVTTDGAAETAPA